MTLQQSRIFYNETTGNLEVDEGSSWVVIPVGGGGGGLPTTASLTTRAALTPATNDLVYVLNIDRLYRWNGARWVAPDEHHGINAIDYGWVGNDSHDDRQSVIDAGTVAAGTGGVGPHVVLIPWTGGRGVFSSSIEVGFGSNNFVLRGLGGPGYPSGLSSQFLRWPAVPIRCDSGPLFTTVSRNEPVALEYIDATGGKGQLYASTPSVGDSATAQVRAWRCGATAGATGSADDAAFISKNAFWFGIDECAFNGPSATSTTTSSTTLSGSFTVDMAAGMAAKLPPSGIMVIGATFTSAARAFTWASKSGNQLQGCASQDTGTFASGSLLTYVGPAVIVRGGDPISGFTGVGALHDITRSTLSGQGIRYEQALGTGGPVPNNFTFSDIEVEASVLGLFSMFNNSGTGTVEMHDLNMTKVGAADPLAPSSVYNATVWVDGTDPWHIYQSKLSSCDLSYGGGPPQFFFNKAGCSVAAVVEGINAATSGFAGASNTNITDCEQHQPGQIRIFSGTLAAHSEAAHTGSSFTFGGGGIKIYPWGGNPNSFGGGLAADPGSIALDYGSSPAKIWVKETGTGTSGWVAH